MAAAARRLAETGLVIGGAGNVSVRTGDRIVITPRGARLARTTPEECLVTDLDGRLVEGAGMASSETGLHCAAYAAKAAGAVVHMHAHFCTVVSSLQDELEAIHYALASFGGPVRVAAYETFGSEELAQAVVRALTDRRGALMRNHGAVTVGDDLDEAVELAETLEWLCSVQYHAKLAGSPHLLSSEDLTGVLAQRTALTPPLAL